MPDYLIERVRGSVYVVDWKSTSRYPDKMHLIPAPNKVSNMFLEQTCENLVLAKPKIPEIHMLLTSKLSLGDLVFVPEDKNPHSKINMDNMVDISTLLETEHIPYQPIKLGTLIEEGKTIYVPTKNITPATQKTCDSLTLGYRLEGVNIFAIAMLKHFKLNGPKQYGTNDIPFEIVDILPQESLAKQGTVIFARYIGN